jgi:hypothetical protein
VFETKQLNLHLNSISLVAVVRIFCKSRTGSSVMRLLAIGDVRSNGLRQDWAVR